MSDALNNERRWVCVHSETSQPCAEVTAHVGCGYPDAAPVPSPVPSRPDTITDEMLRAANVHHGDSCSYCTSVGDIDCPTAAVLDALADAQPAADQGPDLSELRAKREAFGDRNRGMDVALAWDVIDAVDRLLDREGGN